MQSLPPRSHRSINPTALEKKIVPFVDDIAIGTRISARLTLDKAAAGPAQIFLAFGSTQGNAGAHDQDIVVQGQTQTVEVVVPKMGLAEIRISRKLATDIGTLEISLNGVVKHTITKLVDAPYIFSVA